MRTIIVLLNVDKMSTINNRKIDCEEIHGVIYCYTCNINGKRYIGQTTNEKERKARFKGKTPYCRGGNSAIDNARKKYGPNNFTYEVLERYTFSTLEEANIKLDEREIYYINLYNTYLHGYNSTKGGHNGRGKKWTPEQLEKIRGKNHWNYGKRYKYKPKPKKCKKVDVYTKEGSFIETCASLKYAAEKYNVISTNIAKVCRNKLNSTGGRVFKYHD